MVQYASPSGVKRTLLIPLKRGSEVEYVASGKVSCQIKQVPTTQTTLEQRAKFPMSA